MLIRFKEVQAKVFSKKSAPRSPLTAANEEHADMGACKDDVGTDIPASELATIFLLTSLVLLPENSRSREVVTLKAVFGLSLLANLYHSNVIAFDMMGVDEAHDLDTCEPTVCQYIAETDLVLDGSANHLDSEVNLAYGNSPIRVWIAASLSHSLLYLLMSSFSLIP